MRSEEIQKRDLINPFSVSIKYRMRVSNVVMFEVMGQFRYHGDAHSYAAKLRVDHPWEGWHWYEGENKEMCEFIDVVVE